MMRFALISAVCIPCVVSAQETVTCTPITSDTEYCNTVEPRQSGYAANVMPDYVAIYRVQRDPLVTVTLVAMPYDRQIGSWEDVETMITDQIMFRGTGPAAALADIYADAGEIAGVDSVRMEFTGRHADGDVMNAWMVDATPTREGVVMVVSMTEGANARPTDLVTAHSAAVTGLRVTP